MGHFTCPSKRTDAGEFTDLFVSNSGSPVFWLTLLYPETIRRMEPLMRELSRLQGEDPEKFMDVMPPLTDIFIDCESAFSRAIRCRSTVQRLFPDPLTLFDDWLSYLRITCWHEDDVLCLDLVSTAYPVAINAFLEKLYNEIEVVGGSTARQLTHPVENIGELTGWDATVTRSFSAQSPAYQALATESGWQQTAKPTASTFKQNAAMLLSVVTLRFAILAVVVYFFPSVRTFIVASVLLILVGLVPKFNFIRTSHWLKRLCWWRN